MRVRISLLPTLTVGLAIAGFQATERSADAAIIANLSYAGQIGNAGGAVGVSLNGNYVVSLSQGGPFLWNVNSVTGGTVDWVPNTSNAGQILTFCMQVTQYISSGNFNVNPLTSAPDSGFVIGQINSTAADALGRLWQSHISEALVDATKAAAFQLAIWKLEYDLGTSTSLSSGYLTTNSVAGITDLAESWVSAALTGNGPIASLYALTKGDGQDQLVQYEPPVTTQSTPTPEPMSLAIWSLVGATFVIPSLKRKRMNATNVVA